ncbi:MAG: hypothetical protein EZS28_020324 [Streblomastix strix]|uniref:Uncharacterized protein n=1 Tax=Streblomastix strix TaxID=222440 RepID=A0A5J4VNN4_9EUKA|nr:MAG: hypothetical protein EZS28_020324 [Streblomastix strix]
MPKMESTLDSPCYSTKLFMRSLNENSPDLQQRSSSNHLQMLLTETNSSLFKKLSKHYRTTYEVWLNTRDKTVQTLFQIPSISPKFYLQERVISTSLLFQLDIQHSWWFGRGKFSKLK